MNDIRFLYPVFFVIAPLAVAAVRYAHHPARRSAAIFSSVADLRGLPVTLAQRMRRWLPYAQMLGLLLLIAALARPQRGDANTRVNTEGIAIETALDISYSMEAIDFQLGGKQVNRLAAVKHVIENFVVGSKELNLPGRPNDLVGLVAFTGIADSRCPLTLDHGALVDTIRSLKVPKPIFDRTSRRVLNEEELATAIGDGVALGIDRLRGVSAKSKVMILLTDGTSNAGVVDPREAAKIAKAVGIKVYTVGVGTNGLVPIPVEDVFGQIAIQSKRFPIDEELLKEIADTTGGKFFRATNSEALAEIYAEIDTLERTKVEEVKFTEYTELFAYLAAPGALLVAGVGFLTATRFRALP